MTHLCRSLRWKSWYSAPSFTEEELAAQVAANEVPWSCLQTAQPWGPDDEACTPEGCGPDRPCFRPSPKLVRRTVA